MGSSWGTLSSLLEAGAEAEHGETGVSPARPRAVARDDKSHGGSWGQAEEVVWVWCTLQQL